MPEAYNFVKKETLAQVFSCEFCEISKNALFTERLWMPASKYLRKWNADIVFYCSIIYIYTEVRKNVKNASSLVVKALCWSKYFANFMQVLPSSVKCSYYNSYITVQFGIIFTWENKSFHHCLFFNSWKHFFSTY